MTGAPSGGRVLPTTVMPPSRCIDSRIMPASRPSEGEVELLINDDAIHVSATDLVGHVNCSHLTTLNFRLARGEIEKPKHWDPSLDLLRERSAKHEAAYIDHLRRGGLQVTVIEGDKVDAEAVEKTLTAMRAGADAIVQAALSLDRKVGRIDVLRRIELPSALGAGATRSLIPSSPARPRAAPFSSYASTPSCWSTRRAPLLLTPMS